ncbi:MAG: c-type cytochrome [Azonexus sp.]|nr:c-type cytochrome [Azonexus sp.]
MQPKRKYLLPGASLGLACLFAFLPASTIAAPLQSGEQVYQRVCAACHGPGPVAAPKLGDQAAWRPLLAEGQAVVTAHGWVGVREMPPRGGVPGLKLEEFGRAVAHMGRAAGADWQDPAGSPSLMKAIRAEEKARRKDVRQLMSLAKDQGRSGAAVYEAVCRHCHESGVAGAPKKGNRADWRDLIKEGQSVLTAHAWVGVRAMPPRGGHPDLSLEEFARAVAEMVSASGGDWRDPSNNPALIKAIRSEIKKRELDFGK